MTREKRKTKKKDQIREEQKRENRDVATHGGVPNVTVDSTDVCGVSDELCERDPCLSDLESKKKRD